MKIILIAIFSLSFLQDVFCSSFKGTRTKIICENLLINVEGNLMNQKKELSATNISIISDQLQEVKVVGLGEFVHGSARLHEQIGSLALAIIEELGARTILLEAPKGAVEQVNKLIDQGQEKVIDVSDLSPIYRIWRTEGFALFLESLRKRNQKSKLSIKLKGIDVRQPTQAVGFLAEKLIQIGRSDLTQEDPFTYTVEQFRELEDTLPFPESEDYNESLNKFKKIESILRLAIQLLKSSKENVFLEQAFHDIESWIRVYSKLINNGHEKGFFERDKYLFESVLTHLHNEGENNRATILIAHFGHLIYDNSDLLEAPKILLGDPVLGTYLKSFFGEKYFHIGVGSNYTEAKVFDGSIIKYRANQNSLESISQKNNIGNLLVPGLSLPSTTVVKIGDTNVEESGSYVRLKFSLGKQAGAYFITDQ